MANKGISEACCKSSFYRVLTGLQISIPSLAAFMVKKETSGVFRDQMPYFFAFDTA